MFSRWGAFVYRHRRIVLVLAIVVGVIGASAAGRAASVLSAGGWLDPGSESAAVANRLADEFGAGRGALIAVYRGQDGSDAKGTAFQGAIAASLADITSDHGLPSRSSSSVTTSRLVRSVVPGDVVGLARHAVTQDEVDRGGVVRRRTATRAAGGRRRRAAAAGRRARW